MSDSDGTLGWFSAVSIALGGMIGGGIFSVLGVVANIAGTGAWVAFVAAGVVALCAGYSYTKLNEVADRNGASVTYVQWASDNTTLAGMVGWTLLFGYVGSMAMYAYAFGSFFVELVGVHAVGAMALRPVVSTAAVGLFVGLNLLGARTSGVTENVLVAVKMVVLLGFGLLGAYYGLRQGKLEFVSRELSGLSPLVAAAVSFVAFQGWQLLFYDRESVHDPDRTIPRAIYTAIPVAVATYVLVAVVTTSLLSPELILRKKEVALAVAARPVLGEAGFVLVGVAALVSTGSAINATLFSAAHFAKGMLREDLLPDQFGDGDADGIPVRTMLLLGLVTVGFTVYGSLEGITSFASLAFIVVFGVMSSLAFTLRDDERVSAVIPTVGVLGTALFAPLMLWHLATREPRVFVAVVLTALAVFVVELTYFERRTLAAYARRIEPEFGE
ncbi:APC family permease [Halospeciosus flavus]|uniref:APC family permease n=1 Tax=Halospeciosus flavus TaxID=3032283 RepID=A0ABD5Z5Y5_9EURY|nr:APC family permease [Halospeciosus flavus]